jgi:hypothetical protein
MKNKYLRALIIIIIIVSPFFLNLIINEHRIWGAGFVNAIVGVIGIPFTAISGFIISLFFRKRDNIFVKSFLGYIIVAILVMLLSLAYQPNMGG